MDLLSAVIAGGAAAVAALACTPLAARLAKALDIVDRPSARKVSDRQGIPLLGGLAVVTGVIIGLAVFRLSAGSMGYGEIGDQVSAFVAGGILLVLVGAWDDRFDLGAWQKIPFQLLAAAIAIDGGFVIDYFTNPFSLYTHTLPTGISWLVTVAWIMLVTNAMNLIDGLDGLTTGTGLIIAGTLGIICFQAAQPAGVVIALIMLGALAGFLPYNFPPARIFLGDAGALFVGFALALVSIQGYRKAALLTFIVPLLSLAVPLLDTASSIWRRWRSGRGIFSADKGHIHHLILAREGSHRRAVLWLYFQTLCFSVIALSFAQLRGYSAYLFLLAVVLLTVRLLRNIGALGIAIEESGSSGRGGGQEPSLEEEDR